MWRLITPTNHRLYYSTIQGVAEALLKVSERLALRIENAYLIVGDYNIKVCVDEVVVATLRMEKVGGQVDVRQTNMEGTD